MCNNRRVGRRGTEQANNRILCIVYFFDSMYYWLSLCTIFVSNGCMVAHEVRWRLLGMTEMTEIYIINGVGYVGYMETL
jgi:hypothetical protein